MIWVIPMAGKGTRTQSLGEFKPFIKIKGHTMLSWFLSSIKHLIKEDDTLIMLTTQYFKEKFHFEEEVFDILSYHKLKVTVKFIFCESTPTGNSATVLHAQKEISCESPIIMINPDQYTDFEIPVIQPNSCYLGVYAQLGQKSGYVSVDKSGKVTSFVEKTNISNIASSGLYIASSGKDIIKALINQIKHEETLKGEHYIGTSFNYLIKCCVDVYPLPVFMKYDLGNPHDIEVFSRRQFTC